MTATSAVLLPVRAHSRSCSGPLMAIIRSQRLYRLSLTDCATQRINLFLTGSTLYRFSGQRSRT